MIGPVMIRSSSSHTAGVVRIARAAIRILGERRGSVSIVVVNNFFCDFSANRPMLIIDADDMKSQHCHHERAVAR